LYLEITRIQKPKKTSLGCASQTALAISRVEPPLNQAVVFPAFCPCCSGDKISSQDHPRENFELKIFCFSEKFVVLERPFKMAHFLTLPRQKTSRQTISQRVTCNFTQMSILRKCQSFANVNFSQISIFRKCQFFANLNFSQKSIFRKF